MTCGLLWTQPFGFRLHFVPGPQPTKVLGCAVTRKVLEGAVSLVLWTHPLQVQVALGRKHLFMNWLSSIPTIFLVCGLSMASCPSDLPKSILGQLSVEAISACSHCFWSYPSLHQAAKKKKKKPLDNVCDLSEIKDAHKIHLQLI